MEAHEAHERIHEAHHGGGSASRRIAVLISVLAMLLAVVETGGKSAQNSSVAANIEAANLWAFFQAKTIRMTTMRTAADALETLQPDDKAEAVAKRVAEWRATAARYNSEPETGEGREELSARAKDAEHRRDHSLAAYHQFEYGAAALQIAIVLASAAVVTGVPVLAFLAASLGAIGVAFGGVGWFAPELFHH